MVMHLFGNIMQMPANVVKSTKRCSVQKPRIAQICINLLLWRFITDKCLLRLVKYNLTNVKYGWQG